MLPLVGQDAGAAAELAAAHKTAKYAATTVLPLVGQDAGAAAEPAAAHKRAKYAALQSRYLFPPTAVELLGPINCSAVSFLSGIGRRIAEVSGETGEGSFLFQR